MCVRTLGRKCYGILYWRSHVLFCFGSYLSIFNFPCNYLCSNWRIIISLFHFHFFMVLSFSFSLAYGFDCRYVILSSYSTYIRLVLIAAWCYLLLLKSTKIRNKPKLTICGCMSSCSRYKTMATIFFFL